MIDRLWRLTRNRYGRAVYEGLARAGIRFATLDVHVRAIDDLHAPHSTLPSAMRITVDRAADISLPDRPDALDGADSVLRAWIDGATVGRVFLSRGRSVHVPPIEASIAIEGAYVWRLAVSRPYRRRGIATALIDRTVERAAERGAPAAYALIALDNIPSKRAFAARGFASRGTISYGRVGRLQRRRVRTDRRAPSIRIDPDSTD